MAAGILIDSMPLEFTLEESKDKPGKYVARGRYACSDKPTENKRLYGPHLWEREIGRLAESMKGRMVFGELDHPADGRTKLQRVSHILTGLKAEGSEIVGESEILDTPNGRILKAILDAGGKVGVSSRGFGTTKVIANGVHEVQEDFKLHTFDFVADPAMKTAYPDVFHEETQKIPEDGMELTLEDLKRDYPGLVEALSGEVKQAALTEINDAHGNSLTEAVSEAEGRTETRLREQFSGELRRVVETVEESAREKATSEALSDPEVAQAKVTLEQIARIIAPFGIPMDTQVVMDAKEEEITKLKGELAERELEVQAARKEATEMKAVATEAAYQLHLERLVAEDDARETIITLVGDIAQYGSTDEIEAKVGAVKEELTKAKVQEQEKAEERDAETKAKLDEQEALLKAAEEKAEEAETEKEKANDRTRKALKVAEEMQLALHVEQRITGHDGADDLRGLCEEAKSIEDVDNIIAGYDKRHPEPPRIDEDQAARIRSRVSLGKERDMYEDTHGRPEDGDGKGNGIDENANDPLVALGLTEEQFDEFAGTKGLDS
ncbi:MAG: hypothetical protein JRG69_04320 [Deltaproteobacteria bacterium]|nr:hypothetical protein [Deltaproteobacteria bacterium]